MAELSVSGICRLTRDCEAKKFTTGTTYKFGICSYRKMAKEGKQTIDFFEADIWSKAGGLEKILTKGKLMYIESAQLRNDQFLIDGQERSKVSIHIFSYEILNTGTQEAVPEPPVKAPFKAQEVAVEAPKVIKPVPVDPETVRRQEEPFGVDSFIPEFADEPPY